MAILSYLIAASRLQQTVDKQQLEAFIWELFHQHLLTFPFAIFVGEARNDVDPMNDNYCWEYIVPNGPDSMLNVMETLLLEEEKTLVPQPYVWYVGNDAQAFKQVFDRVPFGEQV